MNKDILARLLATENITVVHENAQTASFNVKDRVLTLPLWDDLTGDNYDHFIGHEVGHALYTPEDGWHDAVCDRGRAYKSFLNVIEDARIERMIQNKYPGLRRNFIKSYKKLMADGFFGADIEEINTFDLIDRINTYFKCGASAGVRIEKDEMSWIKEIEACKTWEEVVDIADRLFAQEKAKKEEEKEMQKQLQEEMGSDDFEEGDTEEVEQDGFGNNDWEMDDDGDEEQEGKGSDSEEGDEEEGEKSETTSTDGEGEGEEEDDSELNTEKELGDGTGETDERPEYSDEPISKTEEALHDNIRKEFSDDGSTQVYNFKLNTNDVHPFIIDYKTVLSFPADSGTENGARMMEFGKNLWKRFQVDNKKTVNYMVKEFEMKKKASEYARTSLSKTGVICPVKMNNYKFSDDIFRKMSVTPEGKNHGMVLMLDWSGSMHKHLKPTIDQLLNLVMFCRQVNIPFRVFAFSDRFDAPNDAINKVNDVDLYTMQYKKGFRLMELFSNKMNRGDFTNMASLLLSVGQNYDKHVSYYLPWQFYLGGTPLDDAIMASVSIVNEFRKANRLDIVNTVFLTDGDSHSIEAKVPSKYKEGSARDNVYVAYFTGLTNIVKIHDPLTKTQYRVTDRDITKQLLILFRNATGSTAIGYRIMPVNKRSIYLELRHRIPATELENVRNALKKDKWTTLTNNGYDKFFALAGGKHLETSNGAIEVADDAKVGQIRQAFKKANANRKNTRVLLSQFIEMVA